MSRIVKKTKSVGKSGGDILKFAGKAAWKVHQSGVGAAVKNSAADSLRAVPGTDWIKLSAALLAFDQAAKLHVKAHLDSGDKIPAGPVYIRNSRNRGAAFHIGQEDPEKIKILTTAVSAAVGTSLAFSLSNEKYEKYRPALALLLGGALSNLTDRIVQGEVTDYFSFRFGSEKFKNLVFNVGDFAIFAGAAGLTIHLAEDLDQ